MSIKLLRLNDVKARVPYSKAQLYALMRDGEFPLPIKLGPRASAWPEHEIDAWVEKRIALSNATGRKLGPRAGTERKAEVS